MSAPRLPSAPKQCFCPAHPRWNLDMLKPSTGRAGFEPRDRLAAHPQPLKPTRKSRSVCDPGQKPPATDMAMYREKRFAQGRQQGGTSQSRPAASSGAQGSWAARRVLVADPGQRGPRCRPRLDAASLESGGELAGWEGGLSSSLALGLPWLSGPWSKSQGLLKDSKGI